MKYIIGICVASLFVLLFIIIANSRSIENDLLTGFWKADAEFCEKAGLEVFLLRIGDKGLMSSTRNGYILAKNGEGLIMNNPIEMCLSGGTSIKPWLSSHRHFTVNFDWFGEEDYDFFPSQQELHYYPEYGKIVLCSSDEIYAVLYKDNIMTEAASDYSLVPDNIASDDSSDEI